MSQMPLHLPKHSVMKKLAVLCSFLIASIMNTNAQTKEAGQPLLRHVVLFSFKSDAKPEQIKAVEEAFVALPGKIKEIKSLEWGVNNSPEQLNQGFTHCFFVTFASEADRAVYLPHPAHKAFGALLKPVLDKVLVVDYWVK
jgi:hypothetical protein